MIDSVLLAVRLIYGISSVAHGRLKIKLGLTNFSDSFGLPIALTWLVVALQIVGGLMFAAGIGVGVVGPCLSMISLAAALLMRWKKKAPFVNPVQPGWDYPLVHALVPLLVSLTGAGAYKLSWVF